MEVELGIRSDTKCEGCVVVLALVIPSWTLIASSVGFNDIWLYCRHETLWFRRSLKLVINDFDLNSFDTTSASCKEKRTFLIQGDEKFCAEMFAWLKPRLRSDDHFAFVSSLLERKDGARLLDTSESLGSSTLKWINIKHNQVGGVTSNKFRVGGTLSRSSKIKKSKVSRTLITVIKSTECGRYTLSPSEQISVKNCMEVDDKLFGSDLCNQMFRLPCVMTKTGFCLRKLTLSEIGSAMDLPVASLSAFSISSQISVDLPAKICNLPPLKILQALANELFSVYTAHSTIASGTPLDIWQPNVLYKDLDYSELVARDIKAAKADDAEANFDLWNIPAASVSSSVVNPLIATGTYDPVKHNPLFDALRKLMFRFYRVSLRRSFMRYLKQTYSSQILKEASDPNLIKDLHRGADAISRAHHSSFWSWDSGSSLFFWRWQSEYQLEARDGVPAFIYWDKVPKYTKPQPRQPNPEVLEHERSKLCKVVDRGYMCSGLIHSLTNYFSIPKGEGDIRMVYDATKCQLNDAIWAPNFWLPTMDYVTNFSTSSTFYGDIDCGEMFLNFHLDPRLRPYAGVDLSQVLGNGKRVWKRWERSGMGFRNSPYSAIRLMSVAKEVIKGDRYNTSNPFHWTKAICNYPGTTSYDPTLPRVYKLNPITKTIANDIAGFVDDFRGAGANYQECLRIMHHFAAEMQYMGIQDAPRKRRPISQRPGAWTGSIILSIPGVGVFLKCMDSKWKKTKDILHRYKSLLVENDRPVVRHKTLEEDVGFLIHIAMTYPVIKPYLRAFYASMNSWRVDRDDNGWKLKGRALRTFYSSIGLDYAHLFDTADELNTPDSVSLTPDFPLYLDALLTLFDGDIPALRLVRGEIVGEAGYGFGDASGKGFGSSWTTKTPKHIAVRVGVWNKEGVDESSNFKELRNTTETLELKGDRGELEGMELFFFTDNSVSESVCYKASSSSETLFQLMLRIKALEMKYKCIIRIIHVAGTRMIAQGTDGISRGDMFEGVLKGESMLEHIPISLSALDRSDQLKPWLLSWLGNLDLDIEFLDETGWFERGHDIVGGRKNCDGKWIPEYKSSILVWSPPPAGASIAAQELRQARHKRTNSIHVFICPRLMNPEWEKHILKGADLVTTIPVGTEYWSKEMHEPLKLALYFPYVKTNPWQLKGSRLMELVGWTLYNMWKDGEGTEGNLLSQLCKCSRRMASMSIRDLRSVLYGRSPDELPLLQQRRGEQTFMEEEEI